MIQSGHVSENQPQGIYIRGLSQFGPCIGEIFLGLIFLVASIDHDLVLHKLTSRLEKVENPYSLFTSLYKHDLDVEKNTTLSTHRGWQPPC